MENLLEKIEKNLSVFSKSASDIYIDINDIAKFVCQLKTQIVNLETLQSKKFCKVRQAEIKFFKDIASKIQTVVCNLSKSIEPILVTYEMTLQHMSNVAEMANSSTSATELDVTVDLMDHL
jgi:hypothetical protein